MLRFFKKYPRQTKDYYSSFMGVVSPALIITIFFQLVLDQPALPTWEKDPIKWIIWLVLGFIFLAMLYFLGFATSGDKQAKRNYHNNFILTLFTTIPIILMVIFNYLVRDWGIKWWIGLGIFVIYYLISQWLYLKFRRK